MEINRLKGEIVTAVTLSGEIIGRLTSVESETFHLDSPRLFIPGEPPGFAPGICMTGNSHPEEAMIFKSTVVAVVKTHPDLAAQWVQATSGIVLQ